MSVEYRVLGPSENPGTNGKAGREVGRDVRSPVLRARRRAATLHKLRNLRATLEMRDVALASAETLEQLHDRFVETYSRRPLADNDGGTMFNSSFWIFAVAALLRPPLILESGTWKGHSSWLMAEASPTSRIVTFDVTHQPDRLSDPRVDYRLGDWSAEGEFARLAPDTLLYFDDHISHRRRIEEAAARGGRFALLDDDVPGHALYATGAPPVPTRSMMQDRELETGHTLEWERNGKIYAYDFTRADVESGARHIRWSIGMPDLTPVNLYVPQAPMTLVSIRG